MGREDPIEFYGLPYTFLDNSSTLIVLRYLIRLD
jgi:hypothetical protein